MRVTILYLAAGNSRRFGENKLLYPLDGKAVYRHLLVLKGYYVKGKRVSD